MSDEPIRRSLDALGRYYVGDVTLQQALAKVCHSALDSVDAAVMAGLSMTVNARVGTYVFTHPEVQAIDQPQYDPGDGPCGRIRNRRTRGDPLDPRAWAISPSSVTRRDRAGERDHHGRHALQRRRSVRNAAHSVTGGELKLRDIAHEIVQRAQRPH
jgi:hypothetical protein